MTVSRVNGIYYNDPADGYTYAILSNDIDAKAFVKELNDGIEPYNKDVEAFNDRRWELMREHGSDLKIVEICGEDYLGPEHRPKFPQQIPKGFKKIQEAYPEIHAQRLHYAEHNERLGKIHREHTAKVREDVDKLLQDDIKRIRETYPNYKMFFSDYSYFEKIWYTFDLTTFKFLSK